MPVLSALVTLSVAVAPLHVATSPQLDGRLEDPAWQTATAFTAFVQKNPDAGGPPSEPTSVRIVYDDEALWVGIDCVQQRSPIVRRLTRRDREVDSDRVEVDLDSRATGRDAFHFQVNAAGVLVDALRYDDTEINADWDDNWEAQVATTPLGWSAELRIPFRALRYARERGQRWGLQVRRFISARHEIDELSPIPRGEAGETSHYASLGPFAALPDHASVEVRPFALASIEHAADGTSTPRASIGGDLKWHLTPTLTLDATINPDFAQVEADQQVLNLSTFETFFPEKRPFFLEGAALFAAPIQVLYTRRIGRLPDAPAVPDGETVRAAMDPSRLWSAAKLIGTVGNDTQIGVLAALTGENRVETDDAVGGHERIADPWSAYTALRVRRGLGERGYVGAFATAVGRFETRDYPMVGGAVLCPDGNLVIAGARCTHDALVAGIDARWRSPSGAYLVDGDVAASTVRGGPPRVQRDGVVIASGDSSPQARLHAAKQDNGPVFEAVIEANGRRFDVNDAGFLERANFIHADLNLGWKTTTPGALVRESTTFAEYFYWRNWRGEQINGGYQLNTQIVFANYWQMFTELHWRPARFDDREVGEGTALQRRGRLGWELSLSTDPRQRVVASWLQAAYFVAHGYTFSGDGDVTLHALPLLDIELLPSVLVARGEPRYVLTDPANGDHVFAQQAASAIGLTLRTTYTFTPRVTLQLYGQLFGETVSYRDFGRAPASDREVELAEIVPASAPVADTGGSHALLNASAVFRWEWRLGSTLFAVYSRSQGAARAFGALDAAPIPWTAGLGAASAQVFLLKLSYWW
ncbi:MAG TPA: DUF5916 domain-containing protein [Kofleriaceae bacterium]|nr:DUF5916 domain-containing protein [Kofleriaceae bacterium]